MENEDKIITNRQQNSLVGFLIAGIVILSILTGLFLLILPPEIVIGGIIVFPSLFIIFIYPFFGLILFTLFLYLRPADIFFTLISFHLAKVVGLTTLIAMCINQTINKKQIYKRCPEVYLVTALFIVVFLSIPTSIWGTNSLDYAIGFLKICIGFFLIINLVTTMTRFKVLVASMVFSGSILAIAAVNSYLHGIDLAAGYRAKGIVSGMFGDPNYLALSLIILIPFSYCLVLRTKNIIGKIIFMVTLISFLAGTIVTFSRGGMLGLAVVLLLLLIKTPKKKTTIFIALILLLLVPFVPQKYWERGKTITEYKADAAIISRIDAWKAGISMMVHRPFGVGAGNFGEGFVLYRHKEAIDPSSFRRVAHNSFIEIGGETGILGLILFITLIIFSMKELKKIDKINEEKTLSFAQATFISLVGYCFSAFFISQAYNWILYYFVSFSVVLKELNKNQEITLKEVKSK